MRLHLKTICLAAALAACLTSCKKSEPPISSPETPSVKPVASPETAKPAAAQTPPAPAGDGILLQAKWPTGNRYVYRMDLDQHSTNTIPGMPKPMQQDVTMAMTYAVSVLGEIPNGGHQVEMEFLANEMEVKMGEQVVISFDSKETGKANDANPFSAPFRKMVGSKVLLQMSSDGKVEKVVNHKEWLDKLMADAGPAGGMLGQQFNEGFIRQLSGFGTGLPAKPVKIGETWPFQMDLPAGPLGKISVDSKVNLAGKEDHEQHPCVLLKFNGVLKGSPGEEAGPMGKMSIEGGKVEGTTWFDPDLGALIESTQDQTMNMTGQMPGGPPGGAQPAPTFSVSLGQKITTKLVELGKTGK